MRSGGRVLGKAPEDAFDFVEIVEVTPHRNSGLDYISFWLKAGQLDKSPYQRLLDALRFRLPPSPRNARFSSGSLDKIGENGAYYVGTQIFLSPNRTCQLRHLLD